MLKEFRALASRIRSAVSGRNPVGSGMFWLSRPNTSGSRVTEQTALTYTAYWRAVCFLSSTLAHLPVDVIRREGSRRVAIPNSPADFVLNIQASDELPAFAAREAAQGHVLTWGGGYYEIEQTRVGDPVALHLITPDRVRLQRVISTGALVYEVSNNNGSNSIFEPSEIFHVRGLAFDGLTGYSPVALFRNSIGMGLSAEQYGASFFGNGALPGGVLTTDKNFDERPEALQRIRESWAEMHQGPQNAHRVAILEDGMTFAGVGIPNNDAQFLENRKFQVQEMARIFNVPPFVVGDLERSTNNNIEAQAIELVVYGIMPWIRRWESEIDVKLLRRRDTGLQCKLNLGALLRGDSVAKSNFYKTMFGMGAYSTNDIRSLEDLDPVENGDVRLVPMNMVRLEDAGTATQNARAGSVPGGDGVTPSQAAALGAVGAAVREGCAAVVVQILERSARKVARAAARHAVKPSEFSTWLAEFWREHAGEVAGDVQVVAHSLARAAAVSARVTNGAAMAAADTAMLEWSNEYRDELSADCTRAAAGGPSDFDLASEGWMNKATSRAEDLVDRIWNAVGAH